MPALDGLRGLAATMVFLVHYQAAFGALLPPGSTLASLADFAARAGAHGVYVFFVLSGFLIYRSLLQRPIPWVTFARRRVRRIYPTYLIVLAAYLAASLLLPSLSKLPKTGVAGYLVANALLLPGVFPITPLVTVAWSLSYEIIFYLLIAVIMLGARMREWAPRQRLLAWAIVSVAWATLPPVAGSRLGQFFLFLPGILVAEWVARGKPARTPRVPDLLVLVAWLVSVVMVTLVIGTPETPVLLQSTQLRVVLGFGALGAATAWLVARLLRPEGKLAAVLGSPKPAAVGHISYSFYLSHGAVINLIYLVVGDPLRALAPQTKPFVALAAMIPVWLACYGVAWVLFHTVESRFLADAPRPAEAVVRTAEKPAPQGSRA
jgi:exopolysaccharide production protein ExoZ